MNPKEQRLLSEDTWSISAIVLWELAKLRQLGHVSLDIASPEFERAMSRIHIRPLGLAVVRHLGFLDFQSDPADELIAATSAVHQVR